MNNMDIVDAAKVGMKKSSNVTYLMDFSSGGKITTEYVATVSIGLSLAESENFYYGDETVSFEYDTGKFKSATIPILKKLDPKNIFSRYILRKKTNTIRPGRIDIAILDSKSSFESPKCAIEVKRDAPSKELLLSDIKRNLEYFKHLGATGTSNLNLALNCSFHSFNDPSKNDYCVTTDQEKNRINSLKTKYHKYLSELKSEIPNWVSVKVEVFTATSFLLDPSPTEEEYELHRDKLHLVLGVIIIFERNFANQPISLQPTSDFDN